MCLKFSILSGNDASAIICMYKHVVGVKEINGTEYLVLDHLSKEPSTYTLRMDGSVLEDYEIVQGYDDDNRPFEDRPRNK